MAQPTKGWYRFIPFLGYHHVVMILIAGSIIMTSIVAAGCTSEGMKNVYLAAFSYSGSRESPSEDTVAATLAPAVANSTQLLEVRVGFIGACAKLPSDTWTCSTSFNTISKQLAIVQAEASNSYYDPLGVIDLAKGFRDNVVFDGLMFISVAFSILSFFLLATFPGWHEEENSEGSDHEVKPFPSRPVSQAALCFLGISAVMTLLSTFWQHMESSNAATLMKLATAGVVQVKLGGTATGLGWAIFVLNAIEFVAILIMVLSIRVLSMMVE